MTHANLIETLSDDERAQFTSKFLERFLDPAFGSLSKSETDLLVFSLLHEVGAINHGMTQYRIARNLRITPTRVRSLTMQMELRDITQTEDSLRQRIVDIISRSRFVKNGSMIQFGIEDPLLREDIVERLKKLGATADSSFNRELVRIQLDAFVDFITDLLQEDRQKVVRKALLKAGMRDDSIKGMLKGALSELGKKVAGSAGEAVAEQAGKLAGQAIGALLGSAASEITGMWQRIFSIKDKPEDNSFEA